MTIDTQRRKPVGAGERHHSHGNKKAPGTKAGRLICQRR